MLQRRLFLAGVWLMVAAGCGNHGEAPPAAAKVDLQVLDFEGIQQLVASHRGKVVVMDAWSTNCSPCVREFPRLVELQERFGRRDVACVSLSFDYEGIGKPEEHRDAVLRFLQGQRARFDNVLSNEASDELYRKFSLAAVPAVFVYDRAGKLRKRFDNENAKSAAEAFTYQQVSDLVARLVAEKAAPNGDQTR